MNLHRNCYVNMYVFKNAFLLGSNLQISNFMIDMSFMAKFDTKNMTFTYRNLLFIALLVLVVFQSHGSDEYVQYYTIEDGLSQNEVTGIIQDSKGFLWFATRGGLNKFDGYNFTTFTSNANIRNRFFNPSIECLCEDSNGNIWIGSKSGGVDQYNPELATWRNFNTSDSSEIRLSGDRIINIIEDSDGKIWFGSWLKGITLYDPQKNSVTYLLPNLRVSKIREFGSQHIWLATNDGIFIYDKAKKIMSRLQDDQLNFEVTSLITDIKNQVVWFTGWGKGLFRYSVRDLKLTQFSVDTEKSSAFDSGQVTNGYSLMQDSNGNIWFGTWGEGLYRFNPASETFSKIEIKPFAGGESNVDYDVILDICQDREGSVWVGTDGGGVCQIEQQPLFRGISLTGDRGKGLKNYHIKSILKDHSGILWVGTRNGLYYSENGKDFIEVKEMIEKDARHKSYPISTRMRLILSVFEDDRHNLWIGTDLGLYQIVKNRNEFFYLRDSDNPQNLIKINCIYLNKNQLFVGTQQQGLWVKDDYSTGKTGFRNFMPEKDSDLLNERISFIAGDSNQRIWLGTYSGIYFYDVERNKIRSVKYKRGYSLSSNIILSWCQYSAATYFIGTPSGLNRLDEQPDGEFTVTKYYKEDGLPNDYIDALTTDENGNLWISTNYGISKFNVEATNWLNFQKSDGLQGQSFSEGCVYKAKNGEIFFGGTSGYNYFKPSEIVENKVLPQTNITALQIHNTLILPGQEYGNHLILDRDITDATSITLNYKENEFSIYFASTSYKAPERNHYQYRLVNNDNDDAWSNSGSNHFVNFSNLKAGDYFFEVRGSNNHNIWPEKPATLKITILPPPWKTTWAFMIYIAFLLGIVWLIRWIAVRQATLNHNLQVEKLHHEQENRISEMKFQFFTNISHEFRTPLTLIFAPLKELLKKAKDYNIHDEALEKISIIYKNTNQLLKLVNQLLDFRKAETENLKLVSRFLNIEDFIQEVSYPFYTLARIKEIDFKFESTLKNKEIWFDRDKMEIILNNLISNALKFTGQGGHVWVAVGESASEVIVKVKDNGKGIPADAIPHIYERFYQVDNCESTGSTGIGLALVKHLIDLHQGIIEVESELGQGTEFRIKLKKGEAHLAPEQKFTSEYTSHKFIDEDQDWKRLLPSRRKKPAASDECVLIVEDNPNVIQYLSNLLEPFYKVESAMNGKEGFEKAVEVIPDLIISDVMMPEMDGFELCNKIKLHRLTTNIPVILLTAKSADQYKLMGIQTGADDYISKPFDPDYLIEKIQKLLLSKRKLKKQYSKSIRLEPSDIEIESSDEIFLKKCIAVIEKNLQNESFSTESLAIELGMSNSSLYRKMKLLTNLSSSEFIRSIRLKRAAQLLLDKNRTVSEVAYEVGFNEMKYFRKIFYNQYHCSPSEYRENILVGSENKNS